ncbi:MAG: single-stranded-DNA-specific exonuclease RecJ [Candidatus Scalindua sp.]|jgi:single-stranded-DNA-specific exonuclease|nr:single-stranded-DNA-specific exonuclease RecJ [Candidatus Scalindua sp.]MBT6561800.1 single-stranded-DNA-specific exonuclease RecJ [Candidatus Scalindua sp.]
MTIQELSQKKWIFPPLNINLQTEISNALRISPLLSQLLINRGLTDVESAKIFLDSTLSLLSDPMLLPDIEKSSERIIDALSRGEKITVYGDYDVDGISSTALMVQCLETLSRLYWNQKSIIDYYIPDRLKEGYGLSVEAIKTLSEMGTKVIITVDCGVNAFKEAKLAREEGIDLIITDHHEPGDKSLDSDKDTEKQSSVSCGCDAAFGLINPKLTTSNYPFRELAGVGVAFMLAWALGQIAATRSDHSTVRPQKKKVANEFKDFLMEAIGLAALGTIADVVPLKQENRILAKYGLSSLQNSGNPGIMALKEVAGLKDKTIHSSHVGFNLGPRINAAGRVGNAKKGVELLTAKCENKAKELAEYLESENKRRQKIQSDILQSARKKVLEEVDVDSEMAIIVSDDSWHQGVIGVVASRLASEFYRPVIIIATDGKIGHGSARSIPDFNLYSALVKCQEYSTDRKILISFGGHAQAAGLKLLKNDISKFKEIFNTVSREQMEWDDMTPTLNVDLEVKLSSISSSLFKELKCLFPHGEGNQVPVFATRNVKAVGQIRRFGVSGKHLGFFVRQGDVSFKAVGFGLGDKIDALKQNNGNCSIVYVLRQPFRKETNSRYNNNDMKYKEDIELELKDIST